MSDEPKKENEEVERLAVVMITRRDQLLLLDKLTELEKRVNKLYRRLKDWEELVAWSRRRRPTKKTRRKPCPRRSK